MLPFTVSQICRHRLDAIVILSSLLHRHTAVGWSAPSLVLSSATQVSLIPFRTAYIGHVYSDDNPGIPEDLIGDNGEISSVCLNRVSDLPLMVYLELDMELKIYVPRSLFVRLFHPPTLSGKQSKRGRTVAPRRFLH